jgi:hypothetical protein
LSEQIETRASWTSPTQRVISSKRKILPARMASMQGLWIMFSGLGPSAMMRAMFHEYLICSSVVPAVPWMVSSEVPEIAAARCSESQLLPVPGSPTSSSARSLARVTIDRSTIESSPKNLRVIVTSTSLPSILALSGFLAPVM